MHGQHYSIQFGRALAASIVVLAHIGAVTNDIGLQLDGWLPFSTGVDLFFVISGYIITLVLQRPIGAIDFLKRRALRILPFLAFFTFVWVAMLAVSGKPLPSVINLLFSLLSLPQQGYPVLGVGWSLEHEVIFYAVATVLLVCERKDLFLPVMVGISAVSVAAHLFLPIEFLQNDFHLLSLYHVEFLAGLVLFRAKGRLTIISWQITFLIGIVGFVSASLLVQYFYGGHIPTQPFGALGIFRVFILAVTSSILLTSFLAMEENYPEMPRIGKLPHAIGNASYGLYLSHPIVFAATGPILAIVWPATISAWFTVPLAFAMSILFALIWYRWAEAPILAYLQGIKPRIKTQSAS